MIKAINQLLFFEWRKNQVLTENDRDKLGGEP
jgi:hypothetical protein